MQTSASFALEMLAGLVSTFHKLTGDEIYRFWFECIIERVLRLQGQVEQIEKENERLYELLKEKVK